MNFFDRILRRVAISRGMSLYQPAQDQASFALYSYANPDGSFDYDRYLAVQEQGNKSKLENVFADERTMAYVAEYLLAHKAKIKRGICHGTRRGLEQKWLSRLLDADVIGTEISSTATEFQNTVRWDFHDENPLWVGAFDFVYSNSHDHAYDPKKALTTWANQLAAGGCIILEHTSQHTEAHANQLDPFGVQTQVFPYLVAKWGGGRFAVTEILDPPFNKPNGSIISLIVIRPIFS